MSPVSPCSLAVLGGDARQRWMAEALERHGALSAVYQLPDYTGDASVLTDPADLSQYTCVVGPTPLARHGQVTLPMQARPLPLSLLLQILQPGQILAGGNLSAALQEQCRQRQIIPYDFLQSPALALANAEITAEGMVAILLQQTPYALQQAPLLLLGFGRCGLLLAQKLQALGAQVTVCELDAQKRSLAEAMGFAALPPQDLPQVLPDCRLLVNTAPAPVLSRELLQRLPPAAMLFELASAPGGIDALAAKDLALFYQNCPGLPGRTAPQTAGELLAQDLLQYLAMIQPTQQTTKKG